MFYRSVQGHSSLRVCGESRGRGKVKAIRYKCAYVFFVSVIHTSVFLDLLSHWSPPVYHRQVLIVVALSISIACTLILSECGRSQGTTTFGVNANSALVKQLTPHTLALNIIGCGGPHLFGLRFGQQ